MKFNNLLGLSPGKYIIVGKGFVGRKSLSINKWLFINKAFKSSLKIIDVNEDSPPYAKLLTTEMIIILTVSDNGYVLSFTPYINKRFFDANIEYRADGSVERVKRVSYNSHYEHFDIYIPKPKQPSESQAKKARASAYAKITADPRTCQLDPSIPLTEYETGSIMYQVGFISRILVCSLDDDIQRIFFGKRKSKTNKEDLPLAIEFISQS